MPGVLEILDAYREMIFEPQFGNPLLHIGYTVGRVLIALGLVMIIGIPWGIAMGSKKSVEGFFISWIWILLTIPGIGTAFLLVLLLGFSNLVPILTTVVAVIAFPVTNLWEATKSLDQDLIEMGQVFQAGRWRRFYHILLPALVPPILASMRTSLSIGWRVSLTAEIFASDIGVGKMFNYWFFGYRIDMLIAWGSSVMIIMVFFQKLIDLYEDSIIVWD